MSKFDDRTPLEEKKAKILVEELELNQAIHVHDVRDQATTYVTAKVTVRPADLGERQTIEGSGKIREINKGGLSSILDRPLLPGRVFHLSFAEMEIEIPSALAVCDRCTVLSDEAFETHFRFLMAQELPRTGSLG